MHFFKFATKTLINLGERFDAYDITQSTVENIMSGKTKNSKLKTLHKLALGLEMTVSELLDFPEMNETIFEDE